MYVQMPLPYPSQSPYEIAQSGYALSESITEAARPGTIRGINPGRESESVQTDIFNDYAVWISAGDWTTRLTNPAAVGNRIIYPACCTGNCRSPRIAARQ